MSNKVNLIKDLTPLDDDSCIKVRIIRLWKLTAFKNPLETWKIKMVLQDEEENKIVATVKQNFCPKFEILLEEGKPVYISNFEVGDNQENPMIVENSYIINFYSSTIVKPCDDYSGPVHGFRFKSFHTLKQEDQQSTVSYDLIGNITICGKLQHYQTDGNKRPFIRSEMKDFNGTKLENITLWGEYACQLNDALGDRQLNINLLVIIMQFMKHKIYKWKPSISTMFGATKLFINQDIPDVRIFKQKLLENNANNVDDDTVTDLPTFSSYSDKNYFLKNFKKVTLNELRSIKTTMSCVVVATVKKIERNSDWYYLACVKCNRSVKQNCVAEKDEYGVIVKKRIAFVCTNNNCGDTEVEYKYKIPLRVMDSTGSFSLPLFDRQAQPILDKSAGEIVTELRKNGDEHSIPADFNKLLEITYAFKVNIKEPKPPMNKYSYAISHLTNDSDIITDLVKPVWMNRMPFMKKKNAKLPIDANQN